MFLYLDKEKKRPIGFIFIIQFARGKRKNTGFVLLTFLTIKLNVDCPSI
jgi:hypothetical protein